MRSRLLFTLPAITSCVALAAACSGGAVKPMPRPRPDASACTVEPGAPEVIPVPPIHTPRWAFEPWISKDISTGPDTYAFVQGFHDRDIPVGVVVLDSPWETNYNTFVPNP